jgi:hypothetical protein
MPSLLLDYISKFKKKSIKTPGGCQESLDIEVLHPLFIKASVSPSERTISF